MKQKSYLLIRRMFSGFVFGRLDETYDIFFSQSVFSQSGHFKSLILGLPG